jgi:hypothetical protein
VNKVFKMGWSFFAGWVDKVFEKTPNG